MNPACHATGATQVDILLSQDGSVAVIVSTSEPPAGIDISQERGLSWHDEVRTRGNRLLSDYARLFDWKRLRIPASSPSNSSNSTVHTPNYTPHPLTHSSHR